MFCSLKLRGAYSAPPPPCCLIIWCSDLCIFLFVCAQALKAKQYLIDFPRLSFCSSKLLSVDQVPVRLGEWRGRKSEKKVFNSLKTLLIVQRELQIGPSCKTLIDLWKVEATAGSHVPMLNCTPGPSPCETAIIKKWVLFQSKSLDDAESAIKDEILLLQLYMISFPDLRGRAAAVPAAERPCRRLSEAHVSHWKLTCQLI